MYDKVNYLHPFYLQKASDYSFSYGVKDLHTGDIKHQWEKKIGDVIKGHYSMVESDGRIRIVDYTADSKNGFKAIVKHKGEAIHPHTDGTSYARQKLLPARHEEPIIEKTILHKPPNIATHFESSHGILSTLNDGEQYQFSTESSAIPQYVSTEANEVAPIKNTYYYIPKEEAEPKKEVKYEFKPYVPKEVGITHELPVDLSLLKQEGKIPVDVSLINPVEIDLSDVNHQSNEETNQKELSAEELKTFLNEYYKNEYKVPEKEEFRPTEPQQPQRKKKRPVTTPGLSNYSTHQGYSYPKPGVNRRGNLRPVQFPPVQEQPLKRALKRMAGNTGYVRYAKTVTYHDDEE